MLPEILGKSKLTWHPSIITKSLAICGILLAIANILVQFAINIFGMNKEWFLLFNMDKEVNIPTLYSTMLLAFCSILINLIARKGKKERDVLAEKWVALKWVFVFLAFDEALQIHEIFIIQELRDMLPIFLNIVWVIPYGILVIVFLNFFKSLIISLPTKIRTFTLISGAIYISGALGLEIVGNTLVREGQIRLHGISYGLIISLEETLEITGLIIFIHTLLRYIFNYQKQKVKLNIRVKSAE